MANIPYSNATGGLRCTMVCSRRNSAYVVSIVSRYMHNPIKAYWNVVNWIMWYLKGSRILVWFFIEIKLLLWVWLVMLIRIMVETLIIGVLFRDIFLLCMVVLLLRNLRFSWLLFYLPQRQNILQLQKVLAKNNRYLDRTKHIFVRHHSIRDTVENGEVVVSKVHTSKNPANRLTTKPLLITKFQCCLNLVNLNSCWVFVWGFWWRGYNFRLNFSTR